MTERALEVGGLQFGAAGVALTGPVTFGLARGEILAVLGPNGAGKTTLLRTLLGALPAVAGRVAWGGRPLEALTPRELARAVAYVPQSPGAAFDLTVAQYVLLGRVGALGAFGAPGAGDRAVADAAIERLGLRALRERPLSRMSGGERQLAALARALAQQAGVLVLDEPAASLDLANQARVVDLLATLARDGHSIVYTTHDPNHALRAGDDALLLRRGAQPLHGRADALLEPRALSQLYDTPIEAARTADGRRVLVPGAGRA